MIWRNNQLYVQEPLNFADSMGRYGRQNNALLKTSDSYSLEPVTILCYTAKGAYGSDGIKVANQLIL